MVVRRQQLVHRLRWFCCWPQASSLSSNVRLRKIVHAFSLFIDDWFFQEKSWQTDLAAPCGRRSGKGTESRRVHSVQNFVRREDQLRVLLRNIKSVVPLYPFSCSCLVTFCYPSSVSCLFREILENLFDLHERLYIILELYGMGCIILVSQFVRTLIDDGNGVTSVFYLYSWLHNGAALKFPETSTICFSEWLMVITV